MPNDTPTIRWVEEFALSTDGWIKAFPLGEYKRNGRTLSITTEKVKRMEGNFKRGVTGYAPPINIEHLPEHGRVGVIKDMEARNDGLYVLPDDEAQAFLKSKKFGYVSPEIVWQNYENNTGEKADDVVVGLAATNTPFFGEHVALFSARDDWNKQELAMADNKQEEFAQADVESEVGELHKLARLLKRFFSPAEAEEIADAVYFLATATFVTGQAPLMQGLMGNYLEQSKNLFVQMQEQVQEQMQTGTLFPGIPGLMPKK